MAKVLVLGGAAETSAMVEALRQAGFVPVLHWARAPQADGPCDTPLRDGLRDAVALVDTTHAFDTEMRRLAHALAPTLPFLRLARAPWQAGREDRWTHASDLPRAVAALAPGARVFAATGRDSVGMLAHHDGPVFLRQLQQHQRTAPPNCTFVFGDGPFAVDDEVRLFEELHIDMVLARNTGGDAGFPKLAAARRLGLPAVLLDPPPVPMGAVYRTIPELIDRLRVRL